MSASAITDRDFLEVLDEVPFLTGADAGVREELTRMATVRRFPKGNILFYEGDPGGAVYLVLSGRVKVSMISEEGREVTLAVFRRGGMLGLVAALEEATHMGNASTLTDASLARFQGDELAGWLKRHPELQSAVLREFAAMIRAAYEKIGEQALLSVKERLRLALLDIARAEGRRGSDDEVTFVRPTHQELADLVGSSRVVISRILKELLEEETALAAKGRVIRVSLTDLVLTEESRAESMRM